MDLGSVEIANLISYVSLTISGILAIFYIRDRRHAKYTIENEYSNQLLAWHASVIEALMALRSACKHNEVEGKRALLLKLSCLIEQGRFYFPNISQKNFGIEKPPAYRGYRNVALDFLVASFNLHHKTYTDQTDKQAEFLQRLFTSVVFEIIRPTDRLTTIRKLTDKYFVKDLSVEDLLEQDQIDAVSHMWDKP